MHTFLSGMRREQAAGFTDGCVSLDQLAEVHCGAKDRGPRGAFDMLSQLKRKSAAEARRAELAGNQSALALISQDAERVALRLDLWDREKMDKFIGVARDFERANTINMV